jgi:hypothetical protein
LKKDEYYETVAPDFEEYPPLQYILRSSQEGDKLTIERSWDPENEASNPKEAWFRRFGESLIVNVHSWISQVYGISAKGCIPTDAALSIDVIITEMTSVWEKLNQSPCSVEDSTVKPPQDPSAETNENPSSCPVTASGPAPVGGRAIWSSSTRGESGTPYYRDFDGSAFQSDTLQGANAIARYVFAHGASSPVCYEQIFVGVTADHKVSGTMWDGSSWKSISAANTELLGGASDIRWNNAVGDFESKSGNAVIAFNSRGSSDSFVSFSTLSGTNTGAWSDPMEIDPFYVGGNQSGSILHLILLPMRLY